MKPCLSQIPCKDLIISNETMQKSFTYGLLLYGLLLYGLYWLPLQTANKNVKNDKKLNTLWLQKGIYTTENMWENC